MAQHRWNKKTQTGNDKCSKCGLIRKSYKVRTRKAVKTKFGAKLLVVTKYQYYRGNKAVSSFGSETPPCKED